MADPQVIKLPKVCRSCGQRVRMIRDLGGLERCSNCGHNPGEQMRAWASVAFVVLLGGLALYVRFFSG